jgi:hypothetical protein
MILQILGGIVRTVLSAYGGNLVAEGWLTQEQLTSGTGAVLVLLAIAWSVWQKSRTRTTPGGEFNPRAEVRKAQRPDHRTRRGAIEVRFLFVVATVVALLFFFFGCASRPESYDARTGTYRPMSAEEAKARGYSFLQRNAHLPWFAPFAFFETLDQI